MMLERALRRSSLVMELTFYIEAKGRWGFRFFALAEIRTGTVNLTRTGGFGLHEPLGNVDSGELRGNRSPWKASVLPASSTPGGSSCAHRLTQTSTNDFMGSLFASVCLVPILLFSSAPGDAAHRIGEDGLPLANRAVTVDLSGGIFLADLVEIYCESTGVRILSSESVKLLTKATQVSGFGGSVTLEPTTLQAFFEGVLVNAGFRLSLLSTGAVTTLSLVNLQESRGRSVSQWHSVPESEVRLWADHNALLIESMVTLDAVDVRQLSTNLRAMFPNPEFESILAAGSSNALIFRGTGRQVADVVALLRRVEAGALATRDGQEAILLQDQAQKDPTAAPEVVVEAAGRGPVEMTLLEDRPHLVTAVMRTAGSVYDSMNVLQSLSYNRHNSENDHRYWFTGDDAKAVMWPKPRFTPVLSRGDDGKTTGYGNMVIQAVQEDLDWILEAHKMVSELAE